MKHLQRNEPVSSLAMDLAVTVGPAPPGAITHQVHGLRSPAARRSRRDRNARFVAELPIAAGACSRDHLERVLWPDVQRACRGALLNCGLSMRTGDRFGWPIGRGLTGIVAVRLPVFVPARGAIQVVATCGVRIEPLEALYDAVAHRAGLRWYEYDPNRQSFVTGFSEVWSFSEAHPTDEVAARMATLVWTEAGEMFRHYESTDEALVAVASGVVSGRLGCEIAPLALMLLGRRREADELLATSVAHFASVDDADEYSRFAAAVRAGTDLLAPPLAGHAGWRNCQR